MKEKSGKCCKNFLKIFDYFGVNFTFRIRGNDIYQSRFGGIIFILFAILFIFYFINSFYNFCSREIYNINYSIEFLKPTPKINLKESGFNFAYAIKLDTNDSFIDPFISDLLNESVWFTQINHSDLRSKNRSILQTKKCEFEDFNNTLDEEIFKSMTNFKCVKMNDNDYIGGSFSDDFYKYIEFQISITDKVFTHNKNVTFNLDYLEKIFKNNPVKLILYSIDTSVNVRNFTHPISNYLRTFLAFVDFNKIQKFNIDFSLLQFSSDSKYLGQNPKSQIGINSDQIGVYSLIVNDRYSLNDYGKNILKVYIRSSPLNIIIDRKYQKLNEFFANLAGMQSNVLIFLYIIVSLMNKFWAQQKIMNKILKFREHIKLTSPSQFNLIKANLRTKKDDNVPGTKSADLNISRNSQERLSVSLFMRYI